jgi:IstB-like ATP binding protein
MERSEILAAMGELKLYGMKAAFDEIIATAVKRQHEPQYVIGDLLTAEIIEKQARSIKYQITIAKLPLAKDIDVHPEGRTPIRGSFSMPIDSCDAACGLARLADQRRDDK